MNRYDKQTLNSILMLRESGKTYKEINDELGVNIPKSTLSYICRGVSMGADYDLRMKRVSIERLGYFRELALEKNKEIQDRRRQVLVEKSSFASERINELEVAKIALSMLYLGEGSKWNSRRGLSLVSSDPKIAKLYLDLLKFCFDINRSNLRYRVQHRADQDSVNLINFWSSHLGIDQSLFYRSYVDKRTIGKKTKKINYMGVCSIYGGGTEIQLELEYISLAVCESLGH